MQAGAASAITLAGLVLMAIKIRADSEPGGIPILLVLIGVAWLLATWTRSRRGPRDG
jgi:hypothetical protein